jgi:thioredoxin reductase (NADPH)
MENIVILGSGPAGCTAAIYAARANLKPLVLAGPQPGGQLTITTDVENFPGFPQGVGGTDLTAKMREQAERFGARFMDSLATSVDLSQRPFRLTVDEKEPIETQVLIIATGARAKYGQVPGEEAFYGKGISACALVDGFLLAEPGHRRGGRGRFAMEESITSRTSPSRSP